MAGGGSVGMGIDGGGAAGAVWYSPRKPVCMKAFPWSLGPLMSRRTSIIASIVFELWVSRVWQQTPTAPSPVQYFRSIVP